MSERNATWDTNSEISRVLFANVAQSMPGLLQVGTKSLLDLYKTPRVGAFGLRQFVGTLRAIPVFTMTALAVDQSLSNELFGPESGVTTVHGAESWTSLVATTMGLDSLGRLRLVVRAKSVGLERGRLVVQAFAKAGAEARPVASAQRAVSREDLLDGVEITLHPNDETTAGHHVLAWIEPGEPDLEYDGLCAKPKAPTSLGRVRALRNTAEVHLQPFAA